MNTKCTVSIGSVTYAEKAMRALASAAIYSEIIKLDEKKSRGCIYGLEFPCSQEENVRAVLRQAGIKTKAFSVRDGKNIL